MDAYEDKFKVFLKEKGLKFTPERQLILRVVFSLHKHFDIDELWEKVHKKDNRLSRATIYRTLPLLVECNLIQETLRCQGRIHYEHIFGHKHHDHMICMKCGKIIEFRDERVKKLEEEICKKYHFKPLEYRLGIKGYCEQCRKKLGV